MNPPSHPSSPSPSRHPAPHAPHAHAPAEGAAAQPPAADPEGPAFSELGLSPESLAAVTAAGFTTPTPVQAKAIPPALTGRDVIGCAATGTGKTLAFVLPILDRLAAARAAEDAADPVPAEAEPAHDGHGRHARQARHTGRGPRRHGDAEHAQPATRRRDARALVLAPTRELVQQIAETVTEYGAARGVRCAYVVGGLAMDPQARALREGREVIVATPGRLLDHIDRGNVRLGSIEVLVLDEADRMLDLGFRPQLEAILAALPAPSGGHRTQRAAAAAAPAASAKDPWPGDEAPSAPAAAPAAPAPARRTRQTMLFSATMGKEVADFARACLSDPFRVEIVRTGTVAARAEQRVYHVDQRTKPDLLRKLLAADQGTTLVFTRTKHRAERLAKLLDRAGFSVARIHGDRSQAQRQTALEGFRSGETRVLVATDVAARGLDVEGIDHVVCFDLSLVPEDHVHRVGRTARAAASGLASSFCAPDEVALLRAIERFTRTTIPIVRMPEGLLGAPVPEPESSSDAKHQARSHRPNRAPRHIGNGSHPYHAGAHPRGPRAGPRHATAATHHRSHDRGAGHRAGGAGRPHAAGGSAHPRPHDARGDASHGRGTGGSRHGSGGHTSHGPAGRSPSHSPSHSPSSRDHAPPPHRDGGHGGPARPARKPWPGSRPGGSHGGGSGGGGAHGGGPRRGPSGGFRGPRGGR